MSGGSWAIGSWKWSEKYGNTSLKYVDKAEFKKVKADGKNNARLTYLGYETGQVNLSMTCKDDKGDGVTDGPINTYVANFLRDINPRGPNAGKAWAWTEDEQDVHNVHDVVVEEVEVERTPGVGSFKVTIKLTSWSKPTAGITVTKTPTTGVPWSPGPRKPQPPGTPPPNFTNTPPVVKP